MRYIWKPRDMTTPIPPLPRPGSSVVPSPPAPCRRASLGPELCWGLDLDINVPAGSLGWKSWNHRIGWENFTRKPMETSIFDGKNPWVSG